MAPCHERIVSLAEKTRRSVQLHRKRNADKKVGIVLFGFPPNAGAVGTAAYLSVFESLFNTLTRMKAEGYTLDVPEDVDALREMVLTGNAAQYGQEANVSDHVTSDTMVGAASTCQRSRRSGALPPVASSPTGAACSSWATSSAMSLSASSPPSGMRATRCACSSSAASPPPMPSPQFYLWLRNTYQADVVLHFGMHGALEFMPGKQAGMGARDWPDRLIGEMPNIYLYAANNPSEASLAKRRSGAVTITHLTPPVAHAGLYKGLQELKDSLQRWRRSKMTTTTAPIWKR